MLGSIVGMEHLVGIRFDHLKKPKIICVVLMVLVLLRRSYMIESTMSIGPAASVILFMITLIGAGVIFRLMRDRIMYEIVTLNKRDRGVEEDISYD